VVLFQRVAGCICLALDKMRTGVSDWLVNYAAVLMVRNCAAALLQSVVPCSWCMHLHIIAQHSIRSQDAADSFWCRVP
jgi:hypothetical protein